MSGNKKYTGGNLKSDLAKIDAHVITPEEYKDIPELTDEWFEAADHYDGDRLVRRGRPRASAPKVPVHIRLSPEIVTRFKATGRGWQTRINAALAEWLEKRP